MKINFSERDWIRASAFAGIVGPLWLGFALVVLTIAEYDFMRGLRWHPLAAPTTDWPSGLALGPYGMWMTVTFILCGLLMIVFAFGLRRVLAPHARGATMLFAFAGFAMLFLIFPTDPTYRTTPATIAGTIHDSAFVALGLTLIPAMGLLARAFARNAEWRRYAYITWICLAFAIPAFLFKGIVFYIFLLSIFAWSEMVAFKVWRT